jgi:rod shape-determining protein MreC
MFRRSHYIALGSVVLLTLIALNLPHQTTTRLKLGIGSLFVPLFGLTGSSERLAGQALEKAASRGELLRQNETLRRENQDLRLQLLQAGDAVRENLRLRKHLGWQPRAPWKLKLARVVLRDPANWWHTVQIDLGHKDGARVNLPVLTPDGALAGRIAAVGVTRSQVVLLGDPNCKVAARVENESRDTGVIGASGPLDSDLVEMAYLSRSASLKPGQEVKTSGLGGIFPKDILIGRVVDSQPVEYGLGSVAQVRLAATLSSLEEVWVLFTGAEGEDTRKER